MQLILKDKTKITCTLNGNNYITKQDVSTVDFSDDNFSEISVDGITLLNQLCSNVFKQGDNTHIIFRPKTEQDKNKDRLGITEEVALEQAEIDEEHDQILIELMATIEDLQNQINELKGE